MQFEIQCSAIKEFDAVTQSYRKCGQSIVVNSGMVGTLVQCPSCENDVEVLNPSQLNLGPAEKVTPLALDTPAQETAAVSLSPQSIASESAPNSATQSDLAPALETKPLVATEHKPDILSNATISQPSVSGGSNPTFSPSNQAPPVAPSLGKTAETSHPSSPPNQVLQAASFSRESSCHKCGTLLQTGQPRCPNCQTPRRAAYIKAEDRVIPRKNGPFGFQYHVDSLMNRSKENETFFKFLGYAIVLLATCLGLFLILLGGFFGFFPGIAIAGGSISMAFFSYYWERMRKNPRMKLPAIGKLGWGLTLTICRVTLFKKVNSKQQFVNSNSEFGDQNVREVRNFNQMKMIDLSGTKITDQSLLYFHNLLSIQYLVISETNVTDDAVHDLQQTIPKAWIWH